MRISIDSMPSVLWLPSGQAFSITARQFGKGGWCSLVLHFRRLRLKRRRRRHCGLQLLAGTRPIRSRDSGSILMARVAMARRQFVFENGLQAARFMSIISIRCGIHDSITHRTSLRMLWCKHVGNLDAFHGRVVVCRIVEG